MPGDETNVPAPAFWEAHVFRRWMLPFEEAFVDRPGGFLFEVRPVCVAVLGS